MAETDRADSRVALKLDNVLGAVSQKPLLWITLIWIALVLPGLFVRGAYFEERTVIGLARGALEDGWWLSPHLYGERIVERPVLLSWITALLSWPVGSILVPVARLPTAIAGWAGAILVYGLVRERSSAVGGVVAALCFVTSPAVFQDAYVAEPDLLVSVLMFAAFVVWWSGEERNAVTIARWLAVSLLLTAAGLLKGPQPLAFFYVGVFAYYLIGRRDWRGIRALLCCGIVPAAVIAGWYFAVYEPGDLELWRAHSRLHFWRYDWATQLFEFLDFVVRFTVAALPSVMILAAARRPRVEKPAAQKNLLTALLLYALPCTVLLVLWPGARYRYAMPAVPALAAAAGLLFDRLRPRESSARYVALCAILGLGCFQIALNWLVMANFPALFAKSRLAGGTIAAVMATNPAPLYAAHGTGDDEFLLYVPPPIRAIEAADLPQQNLPAWALLTPEQARQLQMSQPDLDLKVRLVLPQYANLRLVYADKR